MRVDGRDDWDPIRRKGSLSWWAGAKVPRGHARLRQCHTLENIPVRGVIRLYHIPTETKKIKRMERVLIIDCNVGRQNDAHPSIAKQ